MTISELRAEGKKRGLDFSPSDKKADLVNLLESTDKTKKSGNLLDRVEKAKTTETLVSQAQSESNAKAQKLKEKEFGTLTYAQRQIVRANADEYVSDSEGKKATVQPRSLTGHELVKDAKGEYVNLIAGKTYTFSDDDFDKLNGKTIHVKTEATKDLCCGSAVWEDIPLLEVTNG